MFPALMVYLLTLLRNDSTHVCVDTVKVLHVWRLFVAAFEGWYISTWLDKCSCGDRLVTSSTSSSKTRSIYEGMICYLTLIHDLGFMCRIFFYAPQHVCRAKIKTCAKCEHMITKHATFMIMTLVIWVEIHGSSCIVAFLRICFKIVVF
jgi:hypothetical protein